MVDVFDGRELDIENVYAEIRIKKIDINIENDVLSRTWFLLFSLEAASEATFL